MLFDESRNITPKRIMLHVNKWWGVVPLYRKCYNAKKILAKRVEGNHDTPMEFCQYIGKSWIEVIQVNHY